MFDVLGFSRWVKTAGLQGSWIPIIQGLQRAHANTLLQDGLEVLIGIDDPFLPNREDDSLGESSSAMFIELCRRGNDVDHIADIENH
jgi:hypothetical protein